MIEVTVVELQKLTKLFSLTADQILNYDENIIPKEVVIEDKSTNATDSAIRRRRQKHRL